MNDARRQRVRQLLEEIIQLLESPEETPRLTALDPDEIELEGMIGRPMLREVRGKTLFTAGLKPNGEDRWVNLVAWNSVAEGASTIQRGMMVRVVGKLRDTQYVNDLGVLTTKQELVASLISPLIGVSSGSTPSRVSPNGITS